MCIIADKITRIFVEKNIISQSEAEWCSYTLQMRLSKVIGFIALVFIGSMVGTFWNALTFMIVFLFLRERTNGFHANSELVCTAISIAMMIFNMVLIRRISNFSYSILFIVSNVIIFEKAPTNNDAIHFNDSEMLAAKRCVRIRQFVVLLGVICMSTVPIVKPAILAVVTDAILLMVAKPKKSNKRG